MKSSILKVTGLTAALLILLLAAFVGSDRAISPTGPASHSQESAASDPGLARQASQPDAQATAPSDPDAFRPADDSASAPDGIVVVERGPAAGMRLHRPAPAEYLARTSTETTATWGAFQQEYPGVDPTEKDDFQTAILRERQKYSIELSREERAAWSSWLTRTEIMANDMVSSRGEHLGIPLSGVDTEGREYILAGFSGALPVYLFSDNREAAISTAASFVRRNATFDPVHGPHLDGGGFFAIVQDSGTVDDSPEFLSDDLTTWRKTVIRGTSTSEHGTHVAGTIGARGLESRAMGMAPAVHIYSMTSFNNSDIVSYGMSYPGEPGKSITGNTSLGTDDPALNGRYTSNSATADQVFYDSPYHLHFYSAGNEGRDATTGGVRYMSITRSRKEAKNLFAVANMQDVSRNSAGVRTGSVTPSSSSSRGPVRDGRIKPDISANGSGVYSPHSPTGYSSRSGTSMAAPNAGGSAILMQDYFSRRFPGHLMRASTLMALLINTAEDVGTFGPDYTYGWGLMNVLEAGRKIQRYAANPNGRALVEDRLNNGQTVTIPYQYDGSGDIRVTLTWTDLPGPIRTASTETLPALINDLNLRVIGPGGTVHLPWVMPYVTGGFGFPPFDPELYVAPATTGVNTTDNKIQVHIYNPVAGAYTVEVSHAGTLTGGFQHYSLAVHGMSSSLPPTAPTIATHPSQSPERQPTMDFVLTGSGFLLGADIIFRRDGFTPVTARHQRVTDGRIQALVDLSEMEAGTWQVVVRNPDGLESVSPTPFEVQYAGPLTFNWTGGSTGNNTMMFNASGLTNWDPTVSPSEVGDGGNSSFLIATRINGGPSQPIGGSNHLSLSVSAFIGQLIFDDTAGHFPADLRIGANAGVSTARLLTFTTPDTTIITLTENVRSRVTFGHDRSLFGDLALRLPSSGVSTIHVAHPDAVLDLRQLFDATSVSGIGYAGIHAGSTILAEDRAALRKTGPGTLDLRIEDAQGNRTRSLIIEGGTVITGKNADFGWLPADFAPDHVVLNGGTLHLDGFTSNSGTTRGFQIGNAGGTFHMTSQNHGISGVISDIPGHQGTVYKSGDTILRFGASNTFSGGTHILEGPLRYTEPDSFGSGTVTMENATRISAWNANIVVPNDFEIMGDLVAFGGDGYATHLAGQIDLMEGARSFEVRTGGAVFGGPLINGSLEAVVGQTDDTPVTLAGTSTFTGMTTIARGHLIVSGSLQAGVTAGRSTVDAETWTGTIAGNGSIGGDVVVDGELTPGADSVGSIGTLTVGGGLTVNAPGIATFEIASPSSADRINVSGPVAIDGSIRVTLLGGFTPAIGNTFTLVAAGSPITLGQSASFDLPDLGPDRRWDTSSFASSGSLVVAGPDPFADWAASFGLTGADAHPDADPDGDGLANSFEFLLGFDPTDPDSNLKAVLALEGDTFRLVINRVIPLGTFTVETAQDLSGSWTQAEVLSIETEAEDHVVILPVAELPRFFRVRFTAP